MELPIGASRQEILRRLGQNKVLAQRAVKKLIDQGHLVDPDELFGLGGFEAVRALDAGRLDIRGLRLEVFYVVCCRDVTVMMTLIEANRQGILTDDQIEERLEYSLWDFEKLEELTRQIRQTKPNFRAIDPKIFDRNGLG